MAVTKPHKVAARCKSHAERHQELNEEIDGLPPRAHHWDETKELKKRRLRHKDIAHSVQASA